MLAKAVVAAFLVLAAVPGCARDGRELFVREGCASCHRFRDFGGGGAPDLTDVASRRSRDWMRRQIRNPTGNNPASRMPPFPGLSEDEIDALVRYLR
jgi:cbb3-type cytochrome oxidase cytochrome c subunit